MWWYIFNINYCCLCISICFQYDCYDKFVKNNIDRNDNCNNILLIYQTKKNATEKVENFTIGVGLQWANFLALRNVF